MKIRGIIFVVVVIFVAVVMSGCVANGKIIEIPEEARTLLYSTLSVKDAIELDTGRGGNFEESSSKIAIDYLLRSYYLTIGEKALVLRAALDGEELESHSIESADFELVYDFLSVHASRTEEWLFSKKPVTNAAAKYMGKLAASGEITKEEYAFYNRYIELEKEGYSSSNTCSLFEMMMLIVYYKDERLTNGTQYTDVVLLQNEQSTPAAEKVNFIEYTAADGSTIRSILQELIAESEDEAFKKAARDIFDTYEKRYIEGKTVSNLSDSARQKARDEVVKHLYELNENGFENAPVAVVNATFSEIEATVLLNYVSFFDGSTVSNTETKKDSGSNQATAAPTQNTQAKTEADKKVVRAIEIYEEAYNAYIAYSGKNNFSEEVKEIEKGSPFISSYRHRKTVVFYEGCYLVYGTFTNGKPDGYCLFYGSEKGNIVENGVLVDDLKVYKDYDLTFQLHGNFSNGKLNGIASIYDNGYSEKDVFNSIKGTFIDGELADGYAEISNKNGSYAGNFINGNLADGYAVIGNEYGTYRGFIKDGKPHGTGVYKSNETTWTGEFADGEFVCGMMFHGGYYYWGYFENWALQGLGSVDDREDRNGNYGYYYYGEFKDSQLVEVLYVDEKTDEEIAAWRANKAENDRLAAQIAGEYMARVAGTGSSSSIAYSSSSASIEKFKNDLAKNQPPDRIISVPTYGTSAEERSVGYKWSYIIGK